MTTTGMIYDYLDSIAPFDTQMSFDNAGLLIGSRGREVRGVLVCLDAASAIAREAVREDCQLIVSHHPVIFSPISAITTGSAPYELVKAGVDVICAHTNLDLADGGVNDCLADALGLTGFSRPEWLECGVFGELPEEMTAAELAALVRDRLRCSGVQLVDGGRPIRRVALIGGAGGDELPGMLGHVDALITGEAKHHILLAARESGCTLICAGHHETEVVVVEPLIRRLAARFNEVRFIPGTQSAPAVCI